MEDTVKRLQRRLAAAAASLFFAGILTGFWAAAAVTGAVDVAIPRLALSAHLNAIIGALWLCAVAWSLPLLRYGPLGRRRLALATAIPAWANWALTLVASVLGVRGLELGIGPANDAVAIGLQIGVVIPTLIAAGAWAAGFSRRGSP